MNKRQCLGRRTEANLVLPAIDHEPRDEKRNEIFNAVGTLDNTFWPDKTIYIFKRRFLPVFFFWLNFCNKALVSNLFLLFPRDDSNGKPSTIFVGCRKSIVDTL